MAVLSNPRFACCDKEKGEAAMEKMLNTRQLPARGDSRHLQARRDGAGR